MEQAPRLIIIAEHQACLTTEHWLQTIKAYAKLLPHYPSVALQLRAKENPSLLQQALLYGQGSQIFVNSSPTYGNILGARALHIPQRDAPPKSPSVPFGISIHEPQDSQEYAYLQPLYFQLGPIYTPLSKRGTPRGLELFHKTFAMTQTPIIAVGGITPKRAKILRSHGCWGVASIGYAMRNNPEEVIRSLL